MLEITAATVKDAKEILALQKLAYQSEAAVYNDYNIPPLIQTLQEIQTEFHSQVFLKAVQTGRIIGSVRAYLKSGTCFIGRLIVHPEFQNQGIGTQLMKAIEIQFSQAQRYELFTGNKSERNLSLYKKLGYQIFHFKQLTDRVTIAYMEKVVRR